MNIERLDHYSVRTDQVPTVIDFYRSLLGLVPGSRPEFPFPGAWLYRADAQGQPSGGSVVHVIGTAEKSGLSDFLGEKSDRPEAGTGSLDHIAFRASGLAAMVALLRAQGTPFQQRRVPGMDLFLVFLKDPCGVTIELNYTSAEDLAAAGAAV
jgi:catechol 2,3-dioxygenase-like lactoylglutathione lyase family enzyme